MSSLNFLGLGALIIELPNDQVRGSDDDEGGHEANHDADFVRRSRARMKRARGFIVGHCEEWGTMRCKDWSCSVRGRRSFRSGQVDAMEKVANESRMSC